MALLTALPPYRLTAQSAPSLTVVANPAFRPTAVLVPHLSYTVATDSSVGGLVLRDLTFPPVTFTGYVRVEGIEPGAREAEARPFPDSVRFDGDGHVTLLVADRAGAPPLAIEVFGSRSATAGRIAVTAPAWPAGRALLVTIEPADIYEHGWRAAGYGVRDRIRVDDQRTIAFVSDPTIASTVIAVGLSPGASGRIQTDAATVVVVPAVPEPVPERRTVGKLVIAIEPARDNAGTARAGIVFGLGGTEDEAVRAMQLGAAEAPLPGVAPPTLRVVAPSADLPVLLGHVLNAARPMLDWDRLAGERTLPSAADDPVVRAADAWYTAQVAVQLGLAEATCSEYAAFKRFADPDGRPPSALAPRLGASGRYLWRGDSAAGTPAEAAAGQLLRAWVCARATRDTAWIAAEGQALRRLAGARTDIPAPGFGPTDLDTAAARRVPPADTGAPAWRRVTELATRGLRGGYGRPAAGPQRAGLSLREAGSLLDLLARGLFGIEEHRDRIEITPHVDGIEDAFEWRLFGWRLSGDSLGIAYRPADRAATIRIGAITRRRLVLRFPWLTAASCAVARRGSQPPERLPLVALVDGSTYVDIRAYWEPAELVVTAGPCDR